MAFPEMVDIVCDGAVRRCAVRDISLGGGALRSDWRPAIGTAIALHIKNVDPFGALVVRHTDDGFAVSFEFKGPGRTTLAARLSYFSEMREHLADLT